MNIFATNCSVCIYNVIFNKKMRLEKFGVTVSKERQVQYEEQKKSDLKYELNPNGACIIWLKII